MKTSADAVFLDDKHTRASLLEWLAKLPDLNMGEKCQAFEESFAKFQGRKHALLFHSGASATLALIQSLKNLGALHAGDNVGISSVAWPTTVMPLVELGLLPVPVDCLPATLNVMSDALTTTHRRTALKALFITHVLGLSGDINEIKRLCDHHGILLLEDAAQALGTTLDSGKKLGNFGAASIFSFGPGHPLHTVQGGMVCTDDTELAKMLTLCRAGGEKNGSFVELGFNLKPTEVTGFLGLAQMKHLKAALSKTEENFLLLEKIVSANSELGLPERSHLKSLSGYGFPILVKAAGKRPHYLQQCLDNGVDAKPVLFGNIQMQPFFRKHVPAHFDLPGASTLESQGFYIPLSPTTTKESLRNLKHALRLTQVKVRMAG